MRTSGRFLILTSDNVNNKNFVSFMVFEKKRKKKKLKSSCKKYKITYLV